jgi:hypothetical protein
MGSPSQTQLCDNANLPPSQVGMVIGTRNLMAFYSIKYEIGSTFKSMVSFVGLLMGKKFYRLGLWVRVCSYNIRTRKPVDFLNPMQSSTYYYFIVNF